MRIPDGAFQRLMGEPRWMKTFARSNRPGLYLRVLEPGEVWAGDPVSIEDHPANGINLGSPIPGGLNFRSAQNSPPKQPRGSQNAPKDKPAKGTVRYIERHGNMAKRLYQVECPRP